MKRPFVGDLYAVCNLGASWTQIWHRLLSGSEQTVLHSTVCSALTSDVPVCAVAGLERRLEGKAPVRGPALRLAIQILDQVRKGRDGTLDLPIHGGTNHGEADILQELVLATHEEIDLPDARNLWHSALWDPIAEHLSQLEEPAGLRSWSYSACTSSMHALACGMMDLCEGFSPEALIVGVDSLSSAGVAGFTQVGACADRQCRPFREDRDGLVVAEGAAAMVLCRRRPDRGLPIRILGLGMSCDAEHPTRPNPDGSQVEAAVRRAIDQAGLKPREIGGVIFHGTGTQANDAAEAAVYRRVWRDAAPPATSIKGSTGHTMGAAGLFNCLAAVEASRGGRLPPSLGESETLEGIDLVCGEPRRIPRGSPVLTTCSGFGGNNVSVVFGTD
jgi:3-oxoacyl-(acyl-carrier-protein) synthase